MQNLTLVSTWLLSVATYLFNTLPSWGVIGLAVISFPILRKLISLAKIFFKF